VWWGRGGAGRIPFALAPPAMSAVATPAHRAPAWHGVGGGPFVGIAATVAVHALLMLQMLLAAGHRPPHATDLHADQPTVIPLRLLPPPPAVVAPEAGSRAPKPVRPALPEPTITAPVPAVPVETTPARPDGPREAASMAAPPAPTAEQWAFAATYTLKNSKAYRYTWGQQVRSMMGTAVEGPDQGMVRFRVEIAPDGALARLDTLWSTSAVAERLARQAIASLPRWPATPTGRPLVFEKTVAFTPFAVDGPPLYKDDCRPDPPAYGNPFAWDGRSARESAPARPAAEPPDAQALADCLRQLPPDEVEAESARDRRLMERWGWTASQPGR